jgi:hypothetical protein
MHSALRLLLLLVFTAAVSATDETAPQSGRFQSTQTGT